MADVLIVCVREDEHQAKAFADMFERAGLNVGGAPSADADLRRSGASVVIWSQASIRSRAFLDAAQRAVNAGKAVVACLIDPPPAASIANSPCFDLRDWSGDAEDPALDPLFFAVDRMVTQARGVAPTGGAPSDTGLAAAAAAFNPRGAPQQQPAAAPPPYARQTRGAPPASSAPTFDPSPRQPPPLRAGPAQGDGVTAEAANWKLIRHSRNPEDFLQHLAKFGSDGAFSELAQLRLGELEQQQAPQSRQRRPAPAAPAAPPPAAAMPAAATPRPVAPPRPAPAPRPAPRPAPAPTPSIAPEPMWGEGAPLAAPRRPEPAVAPVSYDAQPRYEPQPQRYEPQQRYERPSYTDHQPIEPRRSGGGAMRAVLLLAVLGIAALGGGAYLAGGLDGLLGGGAQTQTAADEWSDAAPDASLASAASEQAAAAPLDAPAAGATTAAAPTPRQVAAAETSRAGVGGIEEDPPARPRTTAQPQTFRPSESTAAAVTPLLPPPIAQATPASAPQLQAPAPAPAQVRLRPGTVTWTERPTASRIAALFPPRALRDGVSGRAELDCLVLTTYQARCVVISESPQGFGFGQAALRASTGFQAARTLDDGAPSVGARTRVAISFRAEN